MRRAPNQLRGIIIAAMPADCAASTGDIAQRARISQQTAAATLLSMLRAGIVTRGTRTTSNGRRTHAWALNIPEIDGRPKTAAAPQIGGFRDQGLIEILDALHTVTRRRLDHPTDTPEAPCTSAT